MKRSRFTEQQIIGILKEQEAGATGSITAIPAPAILISIRPGNGEIFDAGFSRGVSSLAVVIGTNIACCAQALWIVLMTAIVLRLCIIGLQ